MIMKNSNRGNALIEFALSFGLITLLMSGTFQFGYSFYVYNKLANAVRAGARYASLRTYDSSSETPSAGFLTAVRNVVVYGDPAGGSQPVAPGLTTDKVSLAVLMSSGVPDTVTVNLNNYQLDAVFATLNWSGKPAATFRYQGRFAP